MSGGGGGRGGGGVGCGRNSGGSSRSTSVSGPAPASVASTDGLGEKQVGGGGGGGGNGGGRNRGGSSRGASVSGSPSAPSIVTTTDGSGEKHAGGGGGGGSDRAARPPPVGRDGDAKLSARAQARSEANHRRRRTIGSGGSVDGGEVFLVRFRGGAGRGGGLELCGLLDVLALYRCRLMDIFASIGHNVRC